MIIEPRQRLNAQCGENDIEIDRGMIRRDDYTKSLGLTIDDTLVETRWWNIQENLFSYWCLKTHAALYFYKYSDTNLKRLNITTLRLLQSYLGLFEKAAKWQAEKKITKYGSQSDYEIAVLHELEHLSE